MRASIGLIAALFVFAGCQHNVDPGNPAPATCDPTRGECPAGVPTTGQTPPTTTPTNQPPTTTPPSTTPPARR
jgi:hypothetical protein